MEKLRRDNMGMGILLGIFLPLLLFGILYGMLYLVELKTGNIEAVTIQKILLISIFPNLFLLRYYLLKLKYDLTGRGVLLATFLYALLFAILELMS